MIATLERSGADPLLVLAAATTVRLADPRNEQARMVEVERALASGRTACDVLLRWLKETLSEYRGSRTAWELNDTASRLRRALDEFDLVIASAADRMIRIAADREDSLHQPVSDADTQSRAQATR